MYVILIFHFKDYRLSLWTLRMVKPYNPPRRRRKKEKNKRKKKKRKIFMSYIHKHIPASNFVLSLYSWFFCTSSSSSSSFYSHTLDKTRVRWERECGRKTGREIRNYCPPLSSVYCIIKIRSIVLILSYFIVKSLRCLTIFVLLFNNCRFVA